MTWQERSAAASIKLAGGGLYPSIRPQDRAMARVPEREAASAAPRVPLRAKRAVSASNVSRTFYPLRETFSGSL